MGPQGNWPQPLRLDGTNEGWHLLPVVVYRWPGCLPLFVRRGLHVLEAGEPAW